MEPDRAHRIARSSSASIGETIDEVLREMGGVNRAGEDGRLPPSPQGAGAGFMDDTYLWSHNHKWLEGALRPLEVKLFKKGLVLNSKKT